jgi:hypothetical protein
VAKGRQGGEGEGWVYLNQNNVSVMTMFLCIE